MMWTGCSITRSKMKGQDHKKKKGPLSNSMYTTHFLQGKNSLHPRNKCLSAGIVAQIVGRVHGGFSLVDFWLGYQQQHGQLQYCR